MSKHSLKSKRRHPDAPRERITVGRSDVSSKRNVCTHSR